MYRYDYFFSSFLRSYPFEDREFGLRPGKSGRNFLKTVEKKINKHFDGVHCEVVALPSANYMFVAMFVARLISNINGEIIDERVLDLIIERKDVNDLQLCLTTKCETYEPLKSFEAHMYKFQHYGVSRKLFLIEANEENPEHFHMRSANTSVARKYEQSSRLKRVKTTHMQVSPIHPCVYIKFQTQDIRSDLGSSYICIM